MRSRWLVFSCFVVLAACGSGNSNNATAGTVGSNNVTLTVKLATGGSTGDWGVKVSPPGTVDHDLYKNFSYASGTVVTLTAVATAAWPFEGWSGDASGNGCVTTVTMNGDKTVTAKIPLVTGAAANCP